MRIFYSFLLLFTIAVLFMVPMPEAIYDFRTSLKTDTFWSSTDGATTSANVTLTKAVYDNDLATITITSNLPQDVPALVDYNTTSRLTDITGLALSSNRTLSVSYDYQSIQPNGVIDSLLDKLPWIWFLCVIGFIPSALIVMWFRRKEI